MVIVAKDNKGKLVAERRHYDEMGRTYNDIAEIKKRAEIRERSITTGYQGLNDNDLDQAVS